MGGAPVAQIRLSADLQPDRVGGAVSQRLPRGGAAALRLRGKLRADRLVRAGLRVRHRRQGAGASRPPHRGLVQQAPAPAVQMIFPPGYLSAKSLKNMLSHKRSVTGQEHTVDTLIEQGIMPCGSPDTVRKQLVEAHRLLGFQNFLAMLQFATLPADLTENNIRLFAREVLPALQTLTDKEYSGLQTQAAE